jgi:hypothetical protein
MGFYPIGGWSVAATTTWADGQVFTYHAPDDVSTEPNNMKWKDRWNINMSVSKAIPLYGSMRAKLTMQIRNLLNTKHLRLPSGEDDRIEYFESDILPYHNTTRQPLIWDWYTNRPREIYFGMIFDF